MTTSQEAVERRAVIRSVYNNSPSWHDKVDRMSDEQVTAIYLRLKAKGKLG